MINLLDFLPIFPDFPKPGIQFRDISPLLAEPKAFTQTIDELYVLTKSFDFDYILGIESRGFVFGSALAQKSAKGLILARKANKLPGKVLSQSYGLEYGHDSLQIQSEILPKSSKVLLIDDVLASGGTLIAGRDLVHQAGSEVTGALVVLEIVSLDGASRLLSERIKYISLLKA